MPENQDDNVIVIGQDANAPYLAFGDECAFKQDLAYAFAIVHRADLKRAEDRLSILRTRYRIPEDEPLEDTVQ